MPQMAIKPAIFTCIRIVFFKVTNQIFKWCRKLFVGFRAARKSIGIYKLKLYFTEKMPKGPPCLHILRFVFLKVTLKNNLWVLEASSVG